MGLALLSVVRSFPLWNFAAFFFLTGQTAQIFLRALGTPIVSDPMRPSFGVFAALEMILLARAVLSFRRRRALSKHSWDGFPVNPPTLILRPKMADAQTNATPASTARNSGIPAPVSLLVGSTRCSAAGCLRANASTSARFRASTAGFT